MVKEVQGGRADGNRRDGGEPTKPSAVVRAVQLTREENALAQQLVQLSDFQLAIKDIAPDKTNKVNDEGRKYRDFAYGPKSGEVTFKKSGKMDKVDAPHLEVLSESDAGYVNVKMNPKEVLEFLTSDAVNQLLEKVRRHERSLPVDDAGREHKNKLAGLTASLRADLGDIRTALQRLEMDVVKQGRADGSPHDKVGTHKPGGIGG